MIDNKLMKKKMIDNKLHLSFNQAPKVYPYDNLRVELGGDPEAQIDIDLKWNDHFGNVSFQTQKILVESFAFGICYASK